MSVVIPTLNAARELPRQLDALVAQGQTREWEVVVADNGSADETRAVATAYSGRLPISIVDASERRGAAAARNIGVGATTGDIVLFCDADDAVAPNWVAAMSAATGTADLLASAIVHQREGRQVAEAPGSPPSLLGWMPYAQTAGCAVRRSVFEDVGGFPEDLQAGEDVAFSWLAQLAGHRFAYVPDAIVNKYPRTGLREEFTQYVTYGRADVDLYVRFRDRGVPEPDLRVIARTYVGLLARAPLLYSPGRRGPWVRQLGRRWGRVRRSIECRVLCP